eukprot:NODE_94_length_21515_cov_0.130417.p5 type:complete len:412 gc:universal NODE_94_length_21515_cov_0.130417:14774-13539(-)
MKFSFDTMTAIDPFPSELVIAILSYCPSHMFLVNKELTQLYLKSKYQYIEFPEQSVHLSSQIFPYLSFIQKLEISLINLTKEFTEFDFSQFSNLKTLIIEDDVDPFNNLPRILSQVTGLNELLCSELDSELVLNSISYLTELKLLEINFPSTALKSVNDLHLLTHLLINSSNSYDGISSYSNIPPLYRITNLVVNEHSYLDFVFFDLVFPSITSLMVQGDFSESVYFSFKHLPSLVNLSCSGIFEIPDQVKHLTCTNNNMQMLFPPVIMTFCSVEFQFEFYDEDHAQLFFQCVDYMNTAKYFVKISFSGELVFMNKFEPPFNSYFYKFIKGMHVFAISGEESVACQDIMVLDFIHEVTEEFLLLETNWEYVEDLNDDEYLQEMMYHLQFDTNFYTESDSDNFFDVNEEYEF